MIIYALGDLLMAGVITGILLSLLQQKYSYTPL